MYRYDEFDTALVKERTEQFRGQVARRLAGDLTEDEFKPLRLMNGLYLQLHAYMLRVAIPYGTLSSHQMRKLAHIARTYDKGYGHFTTRQNIQYNWPRLSDVPDILSELRDVEMHAIQTSGNCIRNVSADHYAGATPEEVTDPRILAEVIRQWSTLHPEFSFLPRKFKIAVTGSPHDRAAIKVHDIGIEARLEDGEIVLDIWAGGGQGRTPVIAKLIKRSLAPSHLLSYLEAVLRVYNLSGRRDNMYKARIKILVNALGADEFARQVEDEFKSILETAPADLPPEELERIETYFAPPAFDTSASDDFAASDPAFAKWVEANTAPHKAKGYLIVNVSLKPIGGAPDATAEQMDVVANLAERFSHDEIRVTHEQNLVLPHVRKADLFKVWQTLSDAGLATPNIGMISDIIACPGLDYCNLANARAIPLSQEISNRFADLERQADLGELKVKISGCINACGHHHVGHIGILGVNRKGVEYYQITLGGSANEDTAIGEIVGPSFGEDEIIDAIETIVTTYKSMRASGEAFLTTYKRVGIDPFKEALYGPR